MARLLLGVSGGIAAYKSLELIRLATAAGHAVRVVATRNALRFVGAPSFEALSGAPVLLDQFSSDPLRGAWPGEERPAHLPIDHLALAERAELLVVAPASANAIAKLAQGLADDLLSTTALACRCPLVVAPAMNEAMYEHPATQRNLELLRERGAHLVGPDRGRLASIGEQGSGRLAEPAQILAYCEALLAGPPPLAGRTVVVSAGGTREPLDAVRYIGNRSSGRMGYALAVAALAAGARVRLIAANVALPDPPGVEVVHVQRAEELERELVEALPDTDLVLMAAAVADFAPANPQPGKLKKEGLDRLELTMTPTIDIISRLVEQRRADQLIVGFAAEHGPDGLALARAKLERKGLDGLVYNDIARPGVGFDAAENEVVVLSPRGERQLARAPKGEVAVAILRALAELCDGWPDGTAGRPS